LPPDYLNYTFLMQRFGYNNGCVSLGFAPATYVLPFVYAIESLLWSAAILATAFRVIAYCSQGLLSTTSCVMLIGIHAFQILSTLCFATCLAVQPLDDFLIKVHTLPFTLYVLMVGTMNLTQLWIGTASGYWDRLGIHWSAQIAFGIWTLFTVPIFVMKACYEVYHLFISWPPTAEAAKFGVWLDIALSVPWLVPLALNVGILLWPPSRKKLEGLEIHVTVPPTSTS